MTDIEKNLEELEKQLEALKEFSNLHGVDLSKEIKSIEDKITELRKEAYSNLSPWDKVNLARHSGRPTSLDYIGRIFEDFIELHGDRSFREDFAIVGGIATLEGHPVTVIGHQKGRDTKENIKRNFGMPHPEGYRKALRLMKQAEKFHRPVICFIDTAGAFCGIGAEERGQGEAIARNLLEMSRLKTPIISIVIGEGGSGGALALGVGDKIYMLEYAVYSVLSPEGFAAILWKDSSKAKEAAEIMKITAQDLMSFKIIDEVVPEPLGGAHKDMEKMSEEIKKYIIKGLKEVKNQSIEDLIQNRYDKFRKIGEYQS
ncbi:MAG: acetyl-CoA carboxylase carboxyl transferase subunit alpha [Epulopiscium sp.]|jgi:acetyl-CoA carboxylase carboxyl transferase subunit alpha|nr:acetyl-CoA carboxylase carboxyl transferase subunit alpha [Defluviitaleaceae bacterium]MDK2786939.1 acetyl-CoA carboxylase carboxyl transferase subunit alpha [Candidatus Epulonipiscium sp.]HHW67491.1 acetyl-CoA carboxylase carboxyltransferase subunit alpha [Candidatus Epulonipiscium sp.]